MATATTHTLLLTGEEREELLRLLEHQLRESLVEEHRTETRDFRNEVIRRENLFRGLIEKLRAK